MFCSNCGASDQPAKTYCRQCGTWIGTAPPEERLSVMIVFNLLSAILAAAGAIALYLTHIGEPSAKWSVYMAATFCLSISVYQVLSFVFALNLRKRLRQGKATKPELGIGKQGELPAADTTQFVRPVSVIENTTELLERKLR